MAEWKSNVGTQSVDLAKQWGRRFGNPVFGLTLGLMKGYLTGNADKGIPSYSYHNIAGCIRWLYAGRGKVNKPITGAGVIATVIKDFIAGKLIEDTWLGYEKPVATVRML